MIRKISVILAIVLALLAVSPVSFAATPLWKEAGEKIDVEPINVVILNGQKVGK